MSSGSHLTTPAEAQAIDHLVEVINHAWLGVLLSLGERLGLHDALVADEMRTTDELAAATGCDERYLGEWLWAMASTGIVQVTPDGPPRFRLAPAYVPALTRAGGPHHWSRICTQVTAFSALEDRLVGSFQLGGGLDAATYEGRIAEVLAGESGPIFERSLLHEALPLTGHIPTLEQGGSFADLGCGTGHAALLVATAYPDADVLGIDQSTDAIAHARTRAAELGLANVRFEVGDLEDELDIPDQDLVLAANVAHDLADPATFFTRVRERLRPGGTLYLHELSATTDMRANITDPHALGILTFSLFHCLPLAKRRPGIAPGGMWGRENYVTALTDAGFTGVEIHRTPSDPNNDTILAHNNAD